ncbi:First ORF in transposon ISC1904 [Saccharolobus solfataricus P2]|uniref:First ORF in transposon ISC1904 n=2 Tax=Saccharolobus solfataricus TaxID=2287 RepID=Q97Y49_SACS2|nr:First ORF in transposon ISC1904 [Saccharolobus solfataricus P2]SAI85170.1 ORF1 in transposon ISC1904 [Saccharolobus solfataricus]
MGIIRKRKVILYARVPSSTQKDELVNQVKYLEEQVKEYDQVISDIGSGLNMKRKGFLKLLRMILNNEVSRVVVAYPDRLVRLRNLRGSVQSTQLRNSSTKPEGQNTRTGDD